MKRIPRNVKTLAEVYQALGEKYAEILEQFDWSYTVNYALSRHLGLAKPLTPNERMSAGAANRWSEGAKETKPRKRKKAEAENK